jgi:cbb3-type cytochrome oxidase subunit 3
MAYLQNSNLWPILLILASPLAIGFVGVVWFVYRRSANEQAA